MLNNVYIWISVFDTRTCPAERWTLSEHPLQPSVMCNVTFQMFSALRPRISRRKACSYVCLHTPAYSLHAVHEDIHYITLHSIRTLEHWFITFIFLRSCDYASWQILIIKSNRCTNFSYRFADRLRASCQQTCTKCTIAVCTVKNSWWRTEKLSEKCRFLFQRKFEKLVHLVGFIVRI